MCSNNNNNYNNHCLYTGTRPDLLFKPEFMSDEEFQDLVQLEGAGSTGSQ